MVPAVASGLSPRVRGNHTGAPPCPPVSRSIPACAGEPPLPPQEDVSVRVYPRVCGGTWPLMPPIVKPNGLSPRVRGNLCDVLVHRLGHRSIPACAGEPCPARPLGHCRRVYPRVCGGTANARLIAASPDGLSPRVRGNLRLGLEHNAGQRSIPACAGEPRPQASRRGRVQVYPRVCGGTLGRTR